jgi:hypothetical protein
MAINIPEFPNPFDPNTPLTNVYAWLSFISLEISSGSGKLTLNLHPNEAAWQGQPLAQIDIALGEPLKDGDPNAEPPIAPINFPTLLELMTIPEFVSAYNTIGGILYQKALDHAKLANATILPPSEAPSAPV